MTETAEQLEQPQNELAVETPETAEPPPSDPPQTDPPTDPPETEEQHRSRAQERIGALIAEKKAITEYAEYWRKKALEDRQPPQPQQPAEDPAPTVDQFEGDTTKWAKAHAEWTQREIDRKAEAALERKLAARQQAEQLQASETTWSSRLTEFTKQKPDAVAVISNPTFTQSETMAKVIKASEKGPELAYYLGTNIAENERIKRLSPEMQAAELGRIEAKLGSAPPPRKQSSAPPPPTPVEGGGTPSVNLETCSLDEYLEARLSRRRKQ